MQKQNYTRKDTVIFKEEREIALMNEIDKNFAKMF